MPLSPFELAVASGAVLMGSAVQGTLGFGFVLLAGPIVSLVEPRALPAVFLLLGFPLEIWMLARERHAVDKTGFLQLTTGRIFGTVIAFSILVVISPDVLLVVVGVSIVLAAIVSLRAPLIEVGAMGRVVAGGISGLMATITAVGGPAMALAYRDREAAELRATLAATFLVGSVVSLGALWASGHLDLWQMQMGAWLLPAEVCGLFVSNILRARLDAGMIRTTMLWLAACGGGAVVLRGVLRLAS